MSSIAIPRTVPEPRPKSVSIPRRKTKIMAAENLFWITRQILRAEDNSELAAILLRIPDLVVAERSDELCKACFASGFADGAYYLAARAAATCANRTPNGQLPKHLVDQLEHWRRGIAAIAGRSA